jgi:ribosomal protein S18 acetylase RimI-like enzyme
VSPSSAMGSSEMVRRLQERAARALPAEHVKDVEGWWLRHAPGCAWWVGTVLPHGAGGTDELIPRVVGAEEFYAGHGASARFQISPGACPEGLDTVLARRGYRRQSPVSLRMASTARVRAQVPAGVTVRLDDRPTRAWLETWHAAHGHGAEGRSEWDMLCRVEHPSVYASAMIGDEIVAVGRAVADTGWAGVFGMATLPQARGRGAARNVLAALADWAGSSEVDRMYLQVERDNIPALRLYEGMGFREVCEYHYRTAE